VIGMRALSSIFETVRCPEHAGSASRIVTSNLANQDLSNQVELSACRAPR
jgi:hypothetical protein